MAIFSLLFFSNTTFFYPAPLIMHQICLAVFILPCVVFVWPIRVETRHPTHKSTHKYHQTNLSEVLEAGGAYVCVLNLYHGKIFCLPVLAELLKSIMQYVLYYNN